MSTTNELHLNLLLTGVGLHPGASRYPGTRPESSLDLSHYRELVATAERGLFDAVFLADSPSLSPERTAQSTVAPEPLTLLSALIPTTTHIGLIASASTSYYEPYNIARLFSSLDHLSKGRAGWNAVTTSSPSAATNFGSAEQPDHDVRYDRAEEFIEVVVKLWENWNEGSRADEVTPINHVGKHFSVSGPFTLPRTPQNHPVIAQAGSSPSGQRLGARFASVIYTNQGSLESSLDFSRRIKQIAAEFGRNPSDVAVLPGVVPILGSTEEEARRLERDLDELVEVESLLPAARRWLGVDLTEYSLDAPFPIELLPDPASIRSSAGTFVQLADGIRRNALTVRQALRRVGGGTIHRVFVGTPEQLVEEFALWSSAGAADGFNIMPPIFPAGLDTFVDQVVPLLQERGLFRSGYSSSTLSGHYRSAVAA